MTAHRLPIDTILSELLRTVRTGSACLLHAPPGAGKTTRVPLALLDIIPPEHGRIIMLEPRRLAAVSAARWMARTLGEEPGGTVGYSIRFDSRTSDATRIEVVTEAILTRRIQADPLLEGVAMVIFDEFHERSIHSDLGLALCLDVQKQVRPELKILVMSATLDCAALADLMGGAPVISSAGRSFPVEEIYLDDASRDPLPVRMAAAACRILEQTSGDLLVFLPGAGEIRSCAAQLAEAFRRRSGIEVHQLYGDLPFEQQQAAIRPSENRKLILATSIAETSLTIDGVTVVLDCGLSRRLRYDPASGMNRLVTVRESRSSAIQRAGRAGRQTPGKCYRLFSRHTFQAMTPHTPAEIVESDLAGLMLELISWGVKDPSTLRWLDSPPEAACEAGRELLRLLSALDAGGCLTRVGQAMARLPLHPRLARLLVRSGELGCVELGCDLAALLSERDIIRRGPQASHAAHISSAERLDYLRDLRSGKPLPSFCDRTALQNVDRIARQLRAIAARAVPDNQSAGGVSPLGRLLLAAYPDRIARLREPCSKNYLLANGCGAQLAGDTPIFDRPWLVASVVDGGGQGDGIIRMADELDETELRDELQHSIEVRDILEWNDREGRVHAFREERIGAVLLTRRPTVPDPAEVLPVVCRAVAESQLELVSRNEAFVQLQGRIQLLRAALPEDGWPDVSDDALTEQIEQWLAPALSGVRSAQHLTAIDLAGALLNSLDYRKQRDLGEQAPTHLTVPSGSRIRLDYASGRQPVLAVKLQELFGLAVTPTVAKGRVAVVLHLLSPAGRPLQVTQDLKGFWDGSYHDVKKEMKGRYPKHPWPDDPWNAPPTRRAKPRGT